MSQPGSEQRCRIGAVVHDVRQARRTLTDIEVASSLGRLTVHRALLASEGCRPAVPEDGPRGALPASGRGRIRTAGSRRDASTIRSRPQCDRACAETPLARLAPIHLSGATRQIRVAARSRREIGHGTLETRSALLDADRRQRRPDPTTALPGWLNARHDELARGRPARKGSDPGRDGRAACRAARSSIKSVRSRRRLPQGEEGDRQHDSARSNSIASVWRSSNAFWATCGFRQSTARRSKAFRPSGGSKARATARSTWTLAPCAEF